MAILRDWFVGDDEPAWALSEVEIAEAVELEREMDALDQDAEDWRLSQPEDEEA
jgi:hypothetical protein